MYDQNDLSYFVAPGNVTGPNLSSEEEIKSTFPNIQFLNAKTILQVGSNGSYTDPKRDTIGVESAKMCNYLKKNPNNQGIDECSDMNIRDKDKFNINADPNNLLVYYNGDLLRDKLRDEKSVGIKSKTSQFLSQINEVEKLKYNNDQNEGIANELDMPDKDEILGTTSDRGFTLGNKALARRKNDFGP